MENPFDPYRDWLHIAPAGRLPTHYELLGLPPFGDDPRKAHAAASERIAHVRKYQAGKHSDVAIRLMNEISQALTCLKDPAAKAAYDSNLRGFATVEDAAAEALFKTAADVPLSDLESRMPPLPPELAGAGGKAFEKLSAAVAAMEPLPGASVYVESATAKLPADAKPEPSPARLPMISALAALLLISLAGLYALSRILSDAGRKHDEQLVVRVPDTTSRPVQTVQAGSSDSVAPAPTIQPAPPATGTQPVDGVSAPSAPIATPAAVCVPPLLVPETNGTWEGRLAEIYVDPIQGHAHLLLKLDAPLGETVEVVSNDRGAFLVLFAYLSDAESSGQGDRLRIEGTAIGGGPALFAQRTQPAVIQLASLGPIGGPPVYRADTAVVPVSPAKLRNPLSFLMRMRPEPDRVYEFPAVFQSVIPDQETGEAVVRLTPGSPDRREMSARFPGVALSGFAMFRPGEDVVLQAEIAAEQAPPQLSLRILHLRKRDHPSVQVGSTQQATNVEANMRTSNPGWNQLGMTLPPAAGTPGIGATAAKAPPIAAPGAGAETPVGRVARQVVAAQIKEARQAMDAKDWATANGIWQELESAELNSAEKVAVTRIKRELTQKASLLIQQANKLKNRDPDKAAQLLSEAMQIDPEGPAGKQAAKTLGF